MIAMFSDIVKDILFCIFMVDIHIVFYVAKSKVNFSQRKNNVKLNFACFRTAPFSFNYVG